MKHRFFIQTAIELPEIRPDSNLNCLSSAGWFDDPMWILRTWCKYWLPVVVWMNLIFVGSTDLLSGQHTSRFLVPLLRWIKPDMSSETMQRIQYGIRKCGHVTEYTVLCMLIWRARCKLRRRDNRPWSWTEAVVAVGVSVLFAASDEIHQSFYAQRYGSALDVMIDAAGAMLGILLLRLLVKRRCSSGSGQFMYQQK